MYPSVITAGGAGSASPIYSVIIEVKLLEQRDMSTPKSNGTTKAFSPKYRCDFRQSKVHVFKATEDPSDPTQTVCRTRECPACQK